jgi:16S rRNA G966 N2-methylase RsmD
MKALYYGDNLQVLRDSIATESVDLIYLDPRFNSNATSNDGLLGQSGRDRMRDRTAACSHEPSSMIRLKHGGIQAHQQGFAISWRAS